MEKLASSLGLVCAERLHRALFPSSINPMKSSEWRPKARMNRSMQNLTSKRTDLHRNWLYLDDVMEAGRY